MTFYIVLSFSFLIPLYLLTFFWGGGVSRLPLILREGLKKKWEFSHSSQDLVVGLVISQDKGREKDILFGDFFGVPICSGQIFLVSYCLQINKVEFCNDFLYRSFLFFSDPPLFVNFFFGGGGSRLPLTPFACKLCTCAHSNFTPVLEDLRSEFYPIEMCVNYIESFIYNWEKFWDF